ncbi:MAG: YceI family protein [Opitutales bacterium]|nr:YceI family protein [Opitutales bacterium]
MKMQRLFSGLLAFSVFASAAAAEVVRYKIDPVHSGIDFRVRHFINMVPGAFTGFEGEIHYDKENPSNSKAVATIDIASVNTRNEDRDKHLQQDDFFNAGEYPKMTFESTSWEPAGDNIYTVTGDLTFHGHTHPVEMQVQFLGEVEGRGVMRSGWRGTANIDRTKWGMDGYTAFIGTTIPVELNIQGHRMDD